MLSGYQKKLAARPQCFYCFWLTNKSWLPGHDGSGYQHKLAARSSCFWLPVQADCQILMFLAASASWLPGHDVSGYQHNLAARSSCFWLPVQTSQGRWLCCGCGILVAFWQHCCQGGRSLKKTNQSLRDWGRVRCSMW